MSWRGVWEESGRRLRRRRRWSGDVPEREISHSGRATRSHAPRCQHSPSALFTSRPYLSLHLRTSVPLSLSLTRPSPSPGLGPGSPSPLQPRCADHSPGRAQCNRDPELAGGGNAAAPRALKPRWQRVARKPGDPLSSRPQPHLPGFNLPEPRPLPPYPDTHPSC